MRKAGNKEKQGKIKQSQTKQPDSSQLKLQLNFVDTPEAAAVAAAPVDVAAANVAAVAAAAAVMAAETCHKKAKEIACKQLKAQQGK